MIHLRTRRAPPFTDAAAVAAAALTLSLSACSGAKVGAAGAGGPSTNGSGATCGTVDLAVNGWVGYEANAAVVAYVAQQSSVAGW